MRVRSQFSHHYERPDDDEVNAALTDATIVLDTNVLLGLYRASPDLRTKRLEVLNAIGSRIFVPHQVGVEFHRNRREVAAGIGAAYDALRAAMSPLQKAVKAFGGEGRYDESAARVKELVDPLLGQIVDGLKELEKDDPHRIDLSNDPILAELEKLLDDRQIGQAPRAKKQAARVRDFEEIRVPLRLPPGFDDAYKIANRGPAAAAGDYLLWCEVLTYARKNETDVVLITDDAKSDWWHTGTGGPDVPHPLLVSEFRRETGQDYFQLSTRDLLRRADVLDITVTTQELAEEDQLAEEAAKRAEGSARGGVTWSGAASGTSTLSGKAFAGLARNFDYGLDEAALDNLTSGMIPAVAIDDDVMTAMLNSIRYWNSGTDPRRAILSAKTFNALQHALHGADEHGRASAAAALERIGQVLAARDALEKREALAAELEELDLDDDAVTEGDSPDEASPISRTRESSPEPPSQQE